MAWTPLNQDGAGNRVSLLASIIGKETASEAYIAVRASPQSPLSLHTLRPTIAHSLPAQLTPEITL